MDKEIKLELKDFVLLLCINSFVIGLWYFAKHHLNFDIIQLFPIAFLIMLGTLAIGGVGVSILFRVYQSRKNKKSESGEIDGKNY